MTKWNTLWHWFLFKKIPERYKIAQLLLHCKSSVSSAICLKPFNFIFIFTYTQVEFLHASMFLCLRVYFWYKFQNRQQKNFVCGFIKVKKSKTKIGLSTVDCNTKYYRNYRTVEYNVLRIYADHIRLTKYK